MTKNKRTKRIVQIALNVVLYVFLAICVVSVLVTVASKKEVDGTAELFGYQMRIVTSESMAKCDGTDVSQYKIKSIPIRSLVFIESVPDDVEEAKQWYSEIEVGDVLTFRYLYQTQVTITHRVIKIEDNGTGGYLIHLMGDNKVEGNELDEQIINTSEQSSFNYIMGKVVGQNYPLGWVISLLQEPVGIVLIVIVPCFIIILLEVIKIFNTLNAEKKKKAADEQESKDKEIAELKRQISELENAKLAAAVSEAEAEEDAETDVDETPPNESDEVTAEVDESDGTEVDEPDSVTEDDAEETEEASDEADASVDGIVEDIEVEDSGEDRPTEQEQEESLEPDTLQKSGNVPAEETVSEEEDQ